MDSVQIEQKSYVMPPREGMSIAHFLTVKDIERSARYYEKVFGARILSLGDRQRAWVSSAREYLDDCERGRRGRLRTSRRYHLASLIQVTSAAS